MNCTTLEIMPVTYRNDARQFCRLYNRILTKTHFLILLSIHLYLHNYAVYYFNLY